MTRVLFRDELLDAQLLRVLGSAAYGGADIGECLETARHVQEDDLGSWYDAWCALGSRVQSLARDEEAAGRIETARLAYLRACSYHRTSGVMLLGVPLDPRLVTAHRAQKAAFQAAMRLTSLPSEMVDIPFGGAHLHGYFFRPTDTAEARASVILIGGYDGTCEELYLLTGAAALHRGYNVLAVDGPGQGSALIEHGLTLRVDWENVIARIIDQLITRPEVDPERIAVIGLSLGAHLAPRAASAEHRLAACIADCGSYDLYAAALERMPPPLAQGLRDGKLWARIAIRPILRTLAAKPTAGWALRRGMLVHGVATPLAYLDSLREFTLRGHAERINCPTWVCKAEEDEISASAPELVNALRCPKKFVQFTTAEGAGDHCEQGARALYHARSFAWLDDLLQPQLTRETAQLPTPTTGVGTMASVHQTLVFDPAGARLAGERHDGAGPTIVALHAGVADRRCWRDTVACLGGGATVISYDRRGYGETPPSSVPFSDLDDLRLVLDELDAGRVWLLGNSMGGELALDFALRAPDRVAGLILLAPAVSGAPELRLDPDTQRLSDLIDEALDAGDLDELNRLEAWLWLDGPSSREGRVGDPARALALAMNAIVVANEREQAELETTPDILAWDLLAEITVPTTVGCGTLDLPGIVARSQTLAESLPRGEFVALEGVAHLPALEAPATVAQLVAAALER